MRGRDVQESALLSCLVRSWAVLGTITMQRQEGDKPSCL